MRRYIDYQGLVLITRLQYLFGIRLHYLEHLSSLPLQNTLKGQIVSPGAT